MYLTTHRFLAFVLDMSLKWIYQKILWESLQIVEGGEREQEWSLEDVRFHLWWEEKDAILSDIYWIIVK